MHKEKQQKYDKMYMDVARRISEMSYCTRAQVGCIIVQGNNIISFGWNGQPANVPNKCEDDNNSTLPSVIHAEQNAIDKIKDFLSCFDTCTMYITIPPCAPCATKIGDFAIISRVVYGEVYRSFEGVEYLKQRNILVEQLI